MSFKVVIPARYASSRFPGKMLADRTGKPLVRHVWERAMAALARYSTRGSALLPAVCLAFSTVGGGKPTASPVAPLEATVSVDSEVTLLQVDGLLAQKLPGLGLTLRKRLAATLFREATAANSRSSDGVCPARFEMPGQPGGLPFPQLSLE